MIASWSTVLSLFNNGWVVGIGTGIISGFAVAYLTRRFVDRKDQTQYVLHVLDANREVLYALRPCVAEGIIPTREIVESMAQSTARKYEVDRANMHAVEEYADDLIKEVMDSNFISTQDKLDYCKRIAALKTEEQLTAASVHDSELATRTMEYRKKLLQEMTSLVGVAAGVATLVGVLRTSGSWTDNLLFSSAIVAGGTLLAFTFLADRPLAALPRLRRRSRVRRRIRHKHSDESSHLDE